MSYRDGDRRVQATSWFVSNTDRFQQRRGRAIINERRFAGDDWAGEGVAPREDLPGAGEGVSESVHANARQRQTGPRGDLAVEGGVTGTRAGAGARQYCGRVGA